MKEQFDSMEAAIAALRNGELLIVVDEADRENEGDLVLIDEAHRIGQTTNHRFTRAGDRTEMPQIDQIIG